MPGLHRPVIDLALPHPRIGYTGAIATLGPTGTSSEAAARYLASYLTSTWPDRPTSDSMFRVELHDRYEHAAESVRHDRSGLLLVANAYRDISVFYMDPTLQILGAFVYDTPLYGLATKPGSSPREGVVRIASHPAPIPIIDQLVDRHRSPVIDVIRYDSTSAAAAAAASGAVDMALTTQPAAQHYGLRFVSRTRNIRMLWSIFGQRPVPNRELATESAETAGA